MSFSPLHSPFYLFGTHRLPLTLNPSQSTHTHSMCRFMVSHAPYFHRMRQYHNLQSRCTRARSPFFFPTSYSTLHIPFLHNHTTHGYDLTREGRIMVTALGLATTPHPHYFPYWVRSLAFSPPPFPPGIAPTFHASHTRLSHLSSSPT